MISIVIIRWHSSWERKIFAFISPCIIYNMHFMHIPSISRRLLHSIKAKSRQSPCFPNNCICFCISTAQPKLHNLLMLTHSLGLSKDLLRFGERVSLSASGGGGTKRWASFSRRSGREGGGTAADGEKEGGGDELHGYWVLNESRIERKMIVRMMCGVGCSWTRAKKHRKIKGGIFVASVAKVMIPTCGIIFN